MQLTFELPHVPALGDEDFFVSASNQTAFNLINGWPDWTNPICILGGPEGAGKTHLVNVWRARSGAVYFPASAVGKAVEAVLSQPQPVAIENIDLAPFDEYAAFHLLNLARERKFDVLLTGRSLPGEWSIALPDLRSRLRSAALICIEPPDDALLRAVLVKLFMDRQLSVAPETIDYLLPRMERSMAGAAKIVDMLDKTALAERRAVTRPLASKLMNAAEPAAEEQP